ncbi:MAG: polyhydroxyalkanoate synthesis repressor PhaR [Gammaproteobacteria bacterium]|nr:polyhydroxyalkanoate synthesis repressor PhaR [Gammaproteobacteria bacterium]MCB1850489.1 polyhydroxyalkanoate synthesis repressor PhaR [Gammaproteobacteria bacterium]MCP5415871.1 polyhydroxyalkanoate synthesis repressor PhaR [Chromatiaceae bacterium]
MSGTRVIKKYPNRRLYDTEKSRYITLSDIRKLVMRGSPFQVIDSNSSEDLTRSILLQIMLEEESGGQPLFSAKMLAQIIRFYGGTMQGMFARYLEQSLSLFTQRQNQFPNPLAQDPLHPMTELAQHNIKLWADVQQSFLRAAGFVDPKAKDE